MLGVVWWSAYTVAAVWCMQFFPGLDFLLPGFVVSLQEERPVETIWLTLIWILLMEGTGSLSFGFAMSWFGGVAAFYLLGGRVFDRRSLTFMCVVGLVAGALRIGFTCALVNLEELSFPSTGVLWEGVLQALVFPPLWFAVQKVFPERLRRDERTA